MTIPDSILKRALSNVYFIWGRGKTTIADHLREAYEYFVYSTDEAKERHWSEANSTDQPYMCRDFEDEYGVRDFWELPKEVIGERERHVQAEVTPMLVTDLIALAAQHPVVLCEGDMDYETVIPFAGHAVYLHNTGKSFDWFSRPDHDSLAHIRARNDLTDAEKEAAIRNAYAATSGNNSHLPDWVRYRRIPVIAWNEETGIAETASAVKQLFGL